MASKDLYKAILSDKGSQKRDTSNNPLSSYMFTEKMQNDDSLTGFYSTNVITVNLAFSGKVNGGIPIGKISQISAPSALGKSIIALSTVRGAQKKNANLITIFIDSEKCFDFGLADKMGIDTSEEKFYVFKENSIENVRNIILKTIAEIPKEERKNIFIVLDSWGTLVTSKLINDGLEGKDVTDMTLAKKKNDLANILLNTDATCLVVNHVYDNIGGFGDPLAIPGGRKIYFNSSCIVLGTSRAKEKDSDKNITGYIITIRTEKSRFSKEKEIFQFRMKHNGGLDPFYGILDDAILGGYVIPGKILDEKETKKQGINVYKDKVGCFQRAHIENDEPIKEEDLYNSKFWLPIFENTDFKQYLENKYQFKADFDIVENEEALSKIM